MPTAEAASTELLGQSDAFLAFMERLSDAARVDRPVLIVGERGTGKELAAGRLHYLSGRWQGPLVALNCSALAPSLLESELFGHEAGAFTGAAARRAGRFEAAHGGTLFLDEIATMPLTAQEKILRVVEYGEFERVGGAAPVGVDVRIVGATNTDLPALADAGRFKRDLLDRLSFEVLTLPPLRAREGDAPLLAEHFATRMAMDMGRDEAPRFSGQAMRALEAHPWPGNVRELKNAVERSVYRAHDGLVRDLILDPFDSPWRPAPDAPAAPEIHGHSVSAHRQRRGESSTQAAPARSQADAPEADPTGALKDAVRDLEIRMLRRALTNARHNQKKAATQLGLSYNQFRGLYRKHRGSLDADQQP